MTDTTADTTLGPAARASRPGLVDRARALVMRRPELPVLLALAAVLNHWALARNGFANTYYSAAVRSMSESWHAFLYGSFDAEGVMTVDKPPLALWIQALSVRLFGFDSWSILVPQAIMGVIAVGLVYDLTRRRFGRPAGVAAGLVMALTPITVAIFRHNNPDALLVLCATAALWFLIRGLEDGRTRWIVLAGVAVGLGFEAKMAAALLVVPAIAAAWLWVAPGGLPTAFRRLMAGAGAMLATALAWPVLVWLTPASQRPWVSGTDDNSIWSLILGYNGLGRLFGQSGGPGGAGGGIVFGGESGPLRLLNEALGGQAGWLLGFAVVAGIGVAVVSRLRRDDPRTGWLIAVGGAFLVTAIAFSRASGIFHPYYVSLLVPMTAALVGAGVGLILRGGRTGAIVGPLAVAGGVLTELMVIRSVSDLTWLGPVLIVGGAVAAGALAADLPEHLRRGALVGALALLLIAPATWAVQTLGHATSGTFPAGGPALAQSGPGGGPGGGGPGGGGPGGPAGGPPGAAGQAFGGPGALGTRQGPGAGAGGPGGSPGSLDTAIEAVDALGGGTIAVASQSGASEAVLDADADVVAIGGFSGRESQVSVDWLADRVAAGDIRWVVTGETLTTPADGRTGASDVLSTVAATCTPATSLSADAPSDLYDCSGLAEALRAAG